MAQQQRALAHDDVVAALGYDPQGSMKMTDLALGDTDSMVGGWRTTAASVDATGGTLTSGASTVKAKKVGRTVSLQIVINVASAGTASGAIRVQLPFAAATNQVLSGRDATTGKMVTGQLIATSPALTVQFYDGSFPGATGAALYLSGVYESAT